MANNGENLNITSSNVYGNCSLKCAYDFNYPKTNVNLTNQGMDILLRFDPTNEPPVTYNGGKYNVTMGFILSPSVHTFNGAQVPAEFGLLHTPVLGGADLVVFIPIIESGEMTNASGMIIDIIQNVSSYAPAQGNTTTINSSDFTLQNMVPIKPFYNYTCVDGIFKNSSIIVYDTKYAISIDSASISTLNHLVRANPFQVPGTELFYNEKGPNSNVNGNGIYTVCSTSSTTEKGYSKSPITSGLQKLDLSKLKISVNSIEEFFITIAIFIIAFLYFLVVLYGIKGLCSLLFGETGKKVKQTLVSAKNKAVNKITSTKLPQFSFKTPSIFSSKPKSVVPSITQN